MIMGMSAATPSRAVRRITKNFGLAAVLVTSLLSTAGAHVATTTPTLITIPPAKLPPLPTTDASAAAAVATIAAACELLPVKLQILHDPRGTGLAMYGALTGKADSAAGALLAVFTHLPTFDPAAVAQLLIADHDDRRAQALFTAMVRDRPVIGIAVAALGGPAAMSRSSMTMPTRLRPRSLGCNRCSRRASRSRSASRTTASTKPTSRPKTMPMRTGAKPSRLSPRATGRRSMQDLAARWPTSWRATPGNRGASSRPPRSGRSRRYFTLFFARKESSRALAARASESSGCAAQ